MRIRSLALSAASLLAVAGSATVLLPSARAATIGCRVDYRIGNQWPGGF